MVISDHGVMNTNGRMNSKYPKVVKPVTLGGIKNRTEFQT
jgi:hypothetical protein